MDNKFSSDIKVPVSGYVALVFAILFFSGLIPVIAQALNANWLNAFDFGKLAGGFGKIGDTGQYFRGGGGSGARDGFMFAITLIPVVMFALGIIELIDHYGGLKAAQKLLTPLLKPLMGIPGVSGLSLIASLQSTDAGAGMMKELKEAGELTENERTIFGMFQFSAGATITNVLSSGAAIIALTQEEIPLIILLAFVVIFGFKILAANMMRIYVKKFGEEG